MAPEHGSANIADPNSGTVDYNPDFNYTGSDSITFQVSDGVLSDTAVISITVAIPNDVPVATADSVSVNEDETVEIVLAGTDNEDDELTFRIMDNPQNGWVDGETPTVTYTPNGDFAGSDSFSFSVSDLLSESAPAIVDITVTPVNDSPVAMEESIFLPMNVVSNITLDGRDPDHTQEQLTYGVLAGPNYGSLTGTPPEISYTPPLDFLGDDYIVWDVSDGSLSSTGVIRITVTDGNIPPDVEDDWIEVDANVSTDITLTATDYEDDELTWSVGHQPGSGILTGVAPNLTYTPNPGFTGGDNFSYRAHDADSDSNPATIWIQVTANPPSADDQSVSVAENGFLAITATGSGEGELTYHIQSGPQHGDLSGTMPNVTYTPHVDYNGSDSFTFFVNDTFMDSPDATVDITITGTNDPPVAQDETFNVRPEVGRDFGLQAHDPETSRDDLAFVVLAGPYNGTLTGTIPDLTYTSDANFEGIDFVVFSASDGLLSDNALVEIHVSDENSPPSVDSMDFITAKNDAYPIELTGWDHEEDPLTFSIVDDPANGVISGTSPNFTYTPDTDYVGSDSFTYKANDGYEDSDNIATVNITVSESGNSAPEAHEQWEYVATNGSLLVHLNGWDPDHSDHLTYSITSGPSNGSNSTIDPESDSLTYTPNTDYSGNDVFTYEVSDGELTDTGDVIIHVGVTNTQAEATPQSLIVNEDTGLGIGLSATDPDGDTLYFNVDWEPHNGTLTGTPPSLTYTPDANWSGNDSFGFSVNDGFSESTNAQIDITVSAVNDGPTANPQTVYVGQNMARNIRLDTSDPDDHPSLEHTVTVAATNGDAVVGDPWNGYVTYTPDTDYLGADSFTITVDDGDLTDDAVITINVGVPNGSPTADAQSVSGPEDDNLAITLTGSDPEVDSLTFEVVSPPGGGQLLGVPPNLVFEPWHNFNGAESFDFVVHDVYNTSAPATVDITITAVPDAPFGDRQGLTVKPGIAREVTLTGQDNDDDELTFAIVSGPFHGTITGSPPTFDYTADNSYLGRDYLIFTVDDGALTGWNVVEFTVSNENTPPVATNQWVSTAANNPIVVALIGEDDDLDDLTFSTVDAPSHGVLSGSPPNVTYTPDEDYIGPDSFTYKANDGTDDSGNATVTLDVTDTPTAFAQSVEVTEDTPFEITLTGDDPQDDPLFFSLDWPTHGSWEGSPPVITYIPEQDYDGPDSFNFYVTDGDDVSQTVEVTITVTGVNDRPVGHRNSIRTGTEELAALHFTGDDPDHEEFDLSYADVAGPVNGTLSGTLPDRDYTSDASFEGNDYVIYSVSDGSLLGTGVVEIVVSNDNIAPVANDQDYDVFTNTPFEFTLDGHDDDEDPLNYVVVGGDPPNGSLSGVAPDLTYTPDTDFTGDDSFTFKVNDTSEDSNIATITFHVADDPGNLPPEAHPQGVSLATNGSASITLHADDDGGPDPLGFSITVAPAHGSASMVPAVTGGVIYTPDTDFTGVDVFTFQVSDGLLTDTAKVHIHVGTTNTMPSAVPQSVSVDEGSALPITATGTDGEGDPLYFEMAGGPHNGVLTGTLPNVTYTPDPDFAGFDYFYFAVSDSFNEWHENWDPVMVSITVNNLNDDPTALAQSVTVFEDIDLEINLGVTDLDEGDSHDFSITVDGTHGTATVTPDTNIVTYSPDLGYIGADTFTFMVDDGAATDTAVVTVDVVAFNATPTANADSVSLDEDASLPITLTGSDPEVDDLTYTIYRHPDFGTLSGTPPSVTYTPNPDYAGSDSFEFFVNDLYTQSLPAIVSITVNNANEDPPIADDQYLRLKPERLRTIELTGSDPDLPSQTLTFAVEIGPQHGTLDQSLPFVDYTSDVGYLGYDYIVFSVDDGTSTTLGLIELHVSTENDRPNAYGQSESTPEGVAVGITLTGDDFDLDPLTFSIVDSPSDGSLTGTPPNVTYTPDALFTGSDSFTFRVNDGEEDSDVATVDIDVY